MIFGRKRLLSEEAAILGRLVEEELPIYASLLKKYKNEIDQIKKKYGNPLIESLVDKGVLVLNGSGYLTINGKKIPEVLDELPELKDYSDMLRRTLLMKYVIIAMKRHITFTRALKATEAFTPATIKKLIEMGIPFPTSVMLEKYEGKPMWYWLEKHHRKMYLEQISQESMLLSKQFLSMLSQNEVDREIVSNIIKALLKKERFFVATALAYYVMPPLLGEKVTEYPLVKVSGSYCVLVGEWCIVLASYPYKMEEKRAFIVFPKAGGRGIQVASRSVTDVATYAEQNYTRLNSLFEELLKNGLVTRYTVSKYGVFNIVKIYIGDRWFILSERIIRRLAP